MNGTSYVCRRERKQNEQQQFYHSDLLSVPILGADQRLCPRIYMLYKYDAHMSRVMRQPPRFSTRSKPTGDWRPEISDLQGGIYNLWSENKSANQLHRRSWPFFRIWIFSHHAAHNVHVSTSRPSYRFHHK